MGHIFVAFSEYLNFTKCYDRNNNTSASELKVRKKKVEIFVVESCDGNYIVEVLDFRASVK